MPYLFIFLNFLLLVFIPPRLGYRWTTVLTFALSVMGVVFINRFANMNVAEKGQRLVEAGYDLGVNPVYFNLSEHVGTQQYAIWMSSATILVSSIFVNTLLPLFLLFLYRNMKHSIQQQEALYADVPEPLRPPIVFRQIMVGSQFTKNIMPTLEWLIIIPVFLMSSVFIWQTWQDLL